MNFDFLPGSSREFSKIEAGDTYEARLAARMRARNPRLESHHFQVIAQIGVAVFLLVAVILAGQQFLGNARLVLILDGQERVFEGRVRAGTTVLDALNASVLAGDINMRFSIDPQREQTMVWALDGYQNRTRSVKLRVSINQKLVDSADLHRAAVNSGDTIAVQIMER